jgi:NTE family protein
MSEKLYQSMDEENIERFYEFQRKSIENYNMALEPGFNLFEGEYWEKLRQRAGITGSIEETVAATDMVKGKLKIFNPETKVVDAILASTAVPGMISPYVINGKLYSDGGILNHFPADLLVGKCESIIGVYVSPVQNLEAKNLNSIKSVTYRALELLTANSSFQKFNYCDVIIEPKELTNYNTFETNKSKMNAIYKIGYEEAKKHFESIGT